MITVTVHTDDYLLKMPPPTRRCPYKCQIVLGIHVVFHVVSKDEEIVMPMKVCTSLFVSGVFSFRFHAKVTDYDFSVKEKGIIKTSK